MPLLITEGAGSTRGYGFGAAAAAAPAAAPVYIEDVFSTYLYTGDSANRTITNGIDLSTKGGAVFFSGRNVATNHSVYDTARGATYNIYTGNTASQIARTTALTGFTASGFTLGSDAVTEAVNLSGTNYASWTFRKQAKFFDIVTYTGNGTSGRSIPHNLGSTPGCIFVKSTSATGDWFVWHRSIADKGLLLTSAAASADFWSPTDTPTSTNILVSSPYGTNVNGVTYVAYLFAHDAGGFGSAGTDNVITCGSFTIPATVNLGYEPQCILYKRTNGPQNWYIYDTMRGLGASGDFSLLTLALGSAEAAGTGGLTINATSFTVPDPDNDHYAFIYIAIRRGPMATPTTGTSVFEPATRTGTGAITTVTTSISPVDMMWVADRNGALGTGPTDFDRLRGANRLLVTSATAAEVTTTNNYSNATNTLASFAVQNGYTLGADAGGYAVNGSGYSFINWNFKRARGFFDEVCYTGTGSTQNISHNLGSTPGCIIIKCRNLAREWTVYHKDLTAGANGLYSLSLQSDNPQSDSGAYPSAPTSSYFTVGPYFATSGSGLTYVAYLFATLAGISKVGSFTGTGGTQTIDCGFGAGGARWLMVKRTDAYGNWYVFDSARGFTSSSSPYLRMNSTAAEVTGNNGCYAASTGFTVTSTANATVNINGATYIFLAIA